MPDLLSPVEGYVELSPWEHGSQLRAHRLSRAAALEVLQDCYADPRLVRAGLAGWQDEDRQERARGRSFSDVSYAPRTSGSVPWGRADL